jgi:GINS complex subunit 1
MTTVNCNSSSFDLSLNFLRESKESGVSLDASQVPLVLLESNSFVRNKRCFLAYLYVVFTQRLIVKMPSTVQQDSCLSRMERARRIQKLRWEIGGVIPEDIKKNMSKTEIDFFCRYDKLLGTYMRSFATTVDLDLTSVHTTFFTTNFSLS